MRLYARRRAMAVRQAVGDGAVLTCAALLAWLGLRVHDVVSRLGAPGRELAEVGANLARAGDSNADRAADVPLLGSALAAPLELFARGGRALADVGAAQQAAAQDVAMLLAVLVTAVPLAALLALWLPPRVRWVREATVAARLEAAGAGEALFALRALAHRPLADLARAEADPWAALQRGDTRRLAELERAALGLPPQP